MAAINGAAAVEVTAAGNIRTHARTQIRNAVAELLKQETSAWALVYKSRIDYPRDVWPYLKVYFDSEQAAALNVNNPRIYERSPSLNVVAMIRIPSSGETESIEEKMDSIALLIEGYLNDTDLISALGAYGVSLELQASAMDVVLTAEEKISHAELTLSYQVKYRALAGVPESFI